MPTEKLPDPAFNFPERWEISDQGIGAVDSIVVADSQLSIIGHTNYGFASTTITPKPAVSIEEGKTYTYTLIVEEDSGIGIITVPYMWSKGLYPPSLNVGAGTFTGTFVASVDSGFVITILGSSSGPVIFSYMSLVEQDPSLDPESNPGFRDHNPDDWVMDQFSRGKFGSY